MVEVDARGLACPEPVMLTKNALQNADSVRVLVDDACALTNVCKFAKNMGKETEVNTKDNESEIIIK